MGTLAVGVLLWPTSALAESGPAATADDTDRGVVICGVERDGPAATAGLKRGDILLSVNGQAVDTLPGLMRALSGFKPGDRVRLTVQHGDETRTLTATLGERLRRAYLGLSPCMPMPATLGLGLALPELPFNLPDRFRFELPDLDGFRFSLPWLGSVQGSLVREVVSGSPAEAAGLRVGDLITHVDGRELDGPSALADAVAARQPGEVLTLTVRGAGDPDGEREVQVTLGGHPDRPGSAYLGVRLMWVSVQRNDDSQQGPFRFFERPGRERPTPPGSMM